MATSPISTSPRGKKLVKTNSGLRMINIIDEEQSAFELEEPQWQTDSEHLICNKCGNKFSFTTRRHHCRRCGKIFCGSCCSAKVTLPRLCFVDPQRVCTDCVVIANKENKFYDEYLPKLMTGGEFQLTDDEENPIVRCKVNPKTHRDLIFSSVKSDSEPHESVVLQDIISFQCLTDPLHQNNEGKGQLVGVNMKYLSSGVNKELRLNISNGVSNRKESLTFLSVLQLSMKMIFESST